MAARHGQNDSQTPQIRYRLLFKTKALLPFSSLCMALYRFNHTGQPVFTGWREMFIKTYFRQKLRPGR